MPDETHPTAADYLPDDRTYDSLSEAARACEGCPLHRDANEVVFGEGSVDADLMLVGESPGREEDETGRPFVGSAGEVLDEALEGAGLRRSTLYVTNAVKHAKWDETSESHTPQAPNADEIKACRPWLTTEIDLVAPDVLVALGRVAARSLLGRSVTISDVRGDAQQTDDGPVVVTYHPGTSLQHPEEEERKRLDEALVEDLTRAARL